MAPSPLELAKPLDLPCGLTLPNRLAKAAMAEQMAAADGLPNERYRRLYRTWGDGGWGLLLTGNVMVDERYWTGVGDVYVPDDPAADAQVVRAWRAWAEAAAPSPSSNAARSPLVMQLSHPGRQSPLGAGKRSLFAKTVAPSAVPLVAAPNLVGRLLSALVFGTPRPMTADDIADLVARFARAARLATEAGFHGVELHVAHGYLLSQFLSPRTNRRTDAYGGSPANRARVVVEIVRAIRRVVPRGFCVGIKLNSVDHQSASELADCVEQLRLIVDAGVDFVEVSGGTYEDPEMLVGHAADSASDDEPKKTAPVSSSRSAAREAFFLDFARAIRSHFPQVPLMVTGGFRTRAGMEAAVASGDCDFVGLGRPACVDPALPRSTILNAEVPDADARLFTKKIEAPWLVKALGLRMVGAGVETMWYSKKIKEELTKV